MRGLYLLGVAVVVACSSRGGDDPAITPAKSSSSSSSSSGGATDPTRPAGDADGGGSSAVTGVAAIDPSATWNIDLENPVDETSGATFFDVDLWDNLESGLVARLHAKNKKVICYFSAGSGEDWRPDYASIPAAALGKGLDGWPGEKWLDTRSDGLRTIMKARLDKAKAAGCDGVDPDNVDGYANDSGFPLTADTQLDYNRFLAREAHARGLAVGLKNDVEQVEALVSSFDFAVNESCFQFNECDAVAAFVAANKSVLNIEYGDVAAHQTSVCPKANALKFFSILSQADKLDGTYTKCR